MSDVEQAIKANKQQQHQPSQLDCSIDDETDPAEFGAGGAVCGPEVGAKTTASLLRL